EIEVLGELKREIRHDSVRRLAYNRVCEPRSAGQQDDRAHSQVAAHLHFFENGDVQADEAEIQNDCEEGIGIKVEIAVGKGLNPAFVSQDVVASQTHEDAQQHIKV